MTPRKMRPGKMRPRKNESPENESTENEAALRTAARGRRPETRNEPEALGAGKCERTGAASGAQAQVAPARDSPRLIPGRPGNGSGRATVRYLSSAHHKEYL